MVIDIIDESQYLTAQQVQLVEDVVRLTAQKLGLHEGVEVDISLVDNETIHALNREYRQIDRPTDVLSFALSEVTSEFDVDFDALQYEEEEMVDEQEALEAVIDDEQAVITEALLPEHLGDIIISYPRCVEQAAEYGHSIDRELAFLTVHGFLHLNGYDHQTEEESAEMFGLQEEVLTAYGLTR